MMAKVLYVLVISCILLFLSQLIETKRKVQSKTDDFETDEIIFTSDQDLKHKVDELTNKKYKTSKGSEVDEDPFDLSYSQRKKLVKDETSLRKKVEIASQMYGKLSKERAQALSALGGNTYKQGKYEESLEYSKEILKIHEKLDGPESEITAKVLQNVGSVACKLNKTNECNYAFQRALYIILQIYGSDSKEDLLLRAKMLTYKVPNAERSEGLSYEDYQFEVDDSEL